jgi:hypothetical protein
VGNQFAQLDELCELCAAGREHAALAIWQELDEDFRVRVMQFAVFVFRNKHYMDDMPSATFETKYGSWTVTRAKLEVLLTVVAKLAQQSGNN